MRPIRACIAASLLLAILSPAWATPPEYSLVPQERPIPVTPMAANVAAPFQNGAEARADFPAMRPTLRRFRLRF